MKISIDLASLMSDPGISVTTSPFAPGKAIIKRSSFPKGVVPPHLRSYLIPSGTGRGMMGTAVYRGKRIRKVALAVAQKYRRG